MVKFMANVTVFYAWLLQITTIIKNFIIWQAFCH